MTRLAQKWILTLPLTAGLLMAWPHPSAYADDAGDQKIEQSKTSASHLQDDEAFHSTLIVVVAVVLLGILASVYFIRKDKDEDKDLEE